MEQIEKHISQITISKLQFCIQFWHQNLWLSHKSVIFHTRIHKSLSIGSPMLILYKSQIINHKSQELKIYFFFLLMDLKRIASKLSRSLRSLIWLLSNKNLMYVPLCDLGIVFNHSNTIWDVGFPDINVLYYANLGQWSWMHFFICDLWYLFFNLLQYYGHSKNI